MIFYGCFDMKIDTKKDPIHERRTEFRKNYHGALSGYSDKILLVGISYDADRKDKKHHTCVIEEVMI